MMREIRIHGRGGQGAVTTGQIMAIAAFYDGKQSQTFPMFGVERAGAPVEAFVRISDEKINIRSQVYAPDVVVVLDASLIKTVDVAKGLKKDGMIIVNSNKTGRDLGIKGKHKVCSVDATTIALSIFKKPIVNTPMLGAFVHFTDLISLDSVLRAVDDKFASGKGQGIADLNKQAVKEVYSSIK